MANWLMNKQNPSIIVAEDKVVSLYPHVLCHRSSDKYPFKIHLIVGTSEDPGYEVWSFDKYLDWESALVDLHVGELLDEFEQMAKDSGRI